MGKLQQKKTKRYGIGNKRVASSIKPAELAHLRAVYARMLSVPDYTLPQYSTRRDVNGYGRGCAYIHG